MTRCTSTSMMAVWALGLAIALASPGGRAYAQPFGRVTVVPLAAADGEPDALHVGQVEAALQGERMTVVSMHEARDRFTARSRPPRQTSESEVDALARAAQDAVEHVAFGRVAQAEKSVREVIARAERTLESLNRETATARQLLDACLSLVRGALQGGSRDLALQQATGCRRLVPDLVPSERAHPANVIGVLAEADDLLRRMRIGRLSVNSAPESGCAVYVNGRHLGTTPFELDRAAAGEYRVQVECAATPGRVHVVQLGDAAVELRVDTDFDRALVSEPRLSLRYPDAAAPEARSVAHAAQLGREIAVDDVVLVQRSEAGVSLLRVRVGQQRLIGRASASRGREGRLSPKELATAIGALNEARLVVGATDGAEPRSSSERLAIDRSPASDSAPSLLSKVPSSGAGALETHEPSDPHLHSASSGAAPLASRARWRVALGAVALVGGAASYGTAYALSAKRARALESADETVRGSASYVRRLARWDAARARAYGSAAAGAVALGGGALALLAARAEPLPWWLPVASGVVGASLAVWGVVEVARGAGCADTIYDRRSCGDAREQRDRGGLFLLSSAPLLTLPLYASVRAARARATAQLAPSWRPALGTLSLALTVLH